MKLVDALSLKYKLYILLSIVIFALLLSAGIGYFNISKMKKNLDSLYFGSLIPVTELNNIQNEYNKELITIFYQLQHDDIIPAEAAEKINLSKKNILKTWASYRSHFKRDYEISYIEYANSEIIKSNKYLENLSKTIMFADEQELTQLSHRIFLKNLSHINEVVNKIIIYESDMAKHERQELLITYDETIYKLVAILIFIVLISLLIMSLVFQSIQNNQVSLIKTSKKLESANKKLETASITDALTNLFNRRYFNLVYNRELTRCIREEKSMSFMMLDIDFFKGYNDSYGHLQGDTALKAVANVMKETLQRPGDYIFRLGGEEFGILISDIDEAQAYNMAERLRLNVESLQIEHKASEISTFLSVSIGTVMLLPDQNIDPEHIIQKADENLYRAKEEGRNRVIISNLIEEENSQSA